VSSFLGPVLVFGLVILTHELGHFFLAKLAGVTVLRLSVGFGPPLWSVRRGETEYRIAVLPLGGYVKLAGQNPDADEPEVVGKSYARLPPRWRSAILLAGPATNLLVAALSFATALAVFGLGYLLPVVGSVSEGSPASAAGLRSGDRILEIDGAPVERWTELGERLADKAGRTVSIVWLRDGERHERTLTPELSSVRDAAGGEVTRPIIGIQPSGDAEVEPVSLPTAVKLGARQTWEVSKLSFVAVYRLVTGETSVSTLAGPVGMAQMSGQAARAGVHALMVVTAILSVNVGVLNLLPIPLFDGGGLLFALIEAVRKRPVAPEVQRMAQTWSIALLLALSLVVLRNDLARLASGP